LIFGSSFQATADFASFISRHYCQPPPPLIAGFRRYFRFATLSSAADASLTAASIFIFSAAADFFQAISLSASTLFS